MLKFQHQLKFQFGETHDRSGKSQLDGPQTLQSGVDINYDDDTVPMELRVMNFKELSCYVVEDILGCVEGRTLLLCITKDAGSDFSNIVQYSRIVETC